MFLSCFALNNAGKLVIKLHKSVPEAVFLFLLNYYIISDKQVYTMTRTLIKKRQCSKIILADIVLPGSDFFRPLVYPMIL